MNLCCSQFGWAWARFSPLAPSLGPLDYCLENSSDYFISLMSSHLISSNLNFTCMMWDCLSFMVKIVIAVIFYYVKEGTTVT